MHYKSYPVGGRIFFPGSHLPTACPVSEDEGWRLLQEAAGPANQDMIKPEKRKVGTTAGSLFDGLSI